MGFIYFKIGAPIILFIGGIVWLFVRKNEDTGVMLESLIGIVFSLIAILFSVNFAIVDKQYNDKVSDAIESETEHITNYLDEYYADRDEDTVIGPVMFDERTGEFTSIIESGDKTKVVVARKNKHVEGHTYTVKDIIEP